VGAGTARSTGGASGVLEECTTDTGRPVAEEDLHANHILEQFQASRSSATMDGVRSTKDSTQAGRVR